MTTPDHPRPLERTTPARPAWTARQAASYCGVGKSTILRALKAEKFPNAERKDGGWSIPVGDLIAAGFQPDHVGETPRTVVRSPARTTPDHPGPISTDELIDLRDQLQHEKVRRELAEQAYQHAQDQVRLLSENLSDLRTTVRMIEASAPTTDLVEPPATAAKRQRWWRKG